MKLYELSNEYQLILDTDNENENENEEIKEKLEQISGDFNKKVLNISAYIQNIESDCNELQALIDTSRDRLRKKLKKIEFLKNYIIENMNVMSIKKVCSTFYDVSVRKYTRVQIVDEAVLDEKYIREKTIKSVDKIALGKDLKTGEVIKGAELYDTFSLCIN